MQKVLTNTQTATQTIQEPQKIFQPSHQDAIAKYENQQNLDLMEPTLESKIGFKKQRNTFNSSQVVKLEQEFSIHSYLHR